MFYIANYDGTDIARPYLVDNSTGTPVYTYLDDDYPPPSNRSKRGAISLAYRLWPKGIIHYRFDLNFTGILAQLVIAGVHNREESTQLTYSV